MPLFRYTAISPAGTMDRGEMEAEDEAGVIRALQRAGSIPVKAVPAGTAGLGALLSLEFGRGESLSRTELTNATRELSIMLGAGQDIDRAMRFLVETAPNRRVSAVLTQVRDALRDGKPLAAALGQQPRSFPRLYIGLVRAGEAGGTLATTLDRLATLLERERSLASTVKSAMIYPALLLAAAIGSVVLLLTSVLPKFVPLFEQNGASLPRSTQLLVDMGDAMSAYGLWMLSALVLLGVAGWQGLQRPGPRLVADRWLLRIPRHWWLIKGGRGGSLHSDTGHFVDQRGATDCCARDRRGGGGQSRGDCRDRGRKWQREGRCRIVGAAGGCANHAVAYHLPASLGRRRRHNSALWRYGQPRSMKKRRGSALGGWYRFWFR